MNEPTSTTAGARTQEQQAAINRMIVNKLTKSVLAAWHANGRKPKQTPPLPAQPKDEYANGRAA